jgi:predicted dehydrogenase
MSRIETIRVGFVGVGGIVTGDRPWGLGYQFVDHPDTAVVAVADVSDETRESGRDHFGLDPGSCYESHTEMLDAETLDAVVVSTPHTLHYGHVVDALDHDLHVLCEKPLVTDVGRARDLVDRTTDSDTTLMIGYQYRLYPAHVEVRDYWRDRDAEPSFAVAQFSQSWKPEGTWRADPDLCGGGFLYDSGSHLLDHLLWTIDSRPTDVSAEMDFLDDAEQIDVRGSIDVRFENGVLATLGLDGESPHVRERVAVHGDQTRTVTKGRGWGNRELTIVEDSGDERKIHIDGLTDPDRGRKAGAFVDAIRDDRDPPADARDGLRVAAVTEAAYDSARAGERVSVENFDR